jgi:hypothetical protein
MRKANAKSSYETQTATWSWWRTISDDAPPWQVDKRFGGSAVQRALSPQTYQYGMWRRAGIISVDYIFYATTKRIPDIPAKLHPQALHHSK